MEKKEISKLVTRAMKQQHIRLGTPTARSMVTTMVAQILDSSEIKQMLAVQGDIRTLVAVTAVAIHIDDTIQSRAK